MAKYICWAFLLLSAACIPVQDVILPQINFDGINESYYYQDTLWIKAAFTDNSNLQSASLSVKRKGISVTPSKDWSFFKLDSIKGRRYLLDTFLVVGEYVSTGSYELTVKLKDWGQTTDTITQTFPFEVFADNKKPVVTGLVLGLPKINGQYVACRGEAFDVAGLATDNLKLSKIQYSLGGNIVKSTLVSTKSILLKQVFSGNFTIPANAQNGTILQFSLMAEDTFGNFANYALPILVDCDDRPPVFERLVSDPTINTGGSVSVVQGSELAFSEIIVSDERMIRDIAVSYDGVNPALKNQTFAINAKGPINFADNLENAAVLFSVASNAPVGTVYTLNFIATDTAGNVSEPKLIKISVQRDNPPAITVTDVFVSGTKKTYTQPLSVKAGDVIDIDGKITDDLKITQLQLKWYLQGEPEKILDTDGTFAQKVISIGNYLDKVKAKLGSSPLIVPASAAFGSVYVMKLSITDSKGQVTVLTYLFKVS